MPAIRTHKHKFDIRSLKVELMAVDALKPFPRNPRDHGKAHVDKIARSIETLGMVVPIICDEEQVLLAGHATLLACKALGMKEVPVISIKHLNEGEKVALRIAHNKLCEDGTWNLELLASNFEFLYNQDLAFDLSVTGFVTAEIDIARMGGKEKVQADAKAAAAREDVVELPDEAAPVASRLGDRFQIGRHVVVCGDARDSDAYKLALGDERADAGCSDSPYNCAVAGNVSGLGKVKHEDFIMASGEMDRETYREFLIDAFRMQAAFSKPGALNLQFTDRHAMFDMLYAGDVVYSELKHICIWKKTNGAMGSLWRCSWEGILVFRVKGGKTHNNVMLGKYGRNRTDVWEYAGVNTFRKGRMEDLQAHPTCKPVALLSDAILDITPIRGIVLDAFLGSGSTILAAHETERRGVGIELDPKYVDVAIRRIEKVVGEPAVHQSGKTFAELGAIRHGLVKDEF